MILQTLLHLHAHRNRPKFRGIFLLEDVQNLLLPTLLTLTSFNTEIRRFTPYISSSWKWSFQHDLMSSSWQALFLHNQKFIALLCIVNGPCQQNNRFRCAALSWAIMCLLWAGDSGGVVMVSRLPLARKHYQKRYRQQKHSDSILAWADIFYHGNMASFQEAEYKGKQDEH